MIQIISKSIVKAAIDHKEQFRDASWEECYDVAADQVNLSKHV